MVSVIFLNFVSAKLATSSIRVKDAISNILFCIFIDPARPSIDMEVLYVLVICGDNFLSQFSLLATKNAMHNGVLQDLYTWPGS